MASRPDGLIRAFGMSGLQISLSMSNIERQFGVDLGHEKKTAIKDRKAAEYEQFEAALRAQAAQMSEFYEVFYCLENSIRKLVADVMVEDSGSDWWNGARVDEDKIRKPAAARRKKEIDSGITPRSDRLIDYTTFGELSQLITDNWELFDPIFQSKTADGGKGREPLEGGSKRNAFETVLRAGFRDGDGVHGGGSFERPR